jgi:hypothetical protein
VGEGALGVELGKQVAQVVVGGVLVAGDVVLGERGLDAVAREHGGALDDRGGRDAVDAEQRRVGDGEFADEVAERGLGDVVGLGAALGDDGVGRAGEDDAAVDALRGEDGLGLVGEQIVGGDVDSRVSPTARR